jgi:lysophospholipase L1-like esterase
MGRAICTTIQYRGVFHLVTVIAAIVLFFAAKGIMNPNAVKEEGKRDPEESCADPLTPFACDEAWHDHHKDLIAAANSPGPFQFVMLGDSITERWNGTRHLGTVVLPENRQVFNSFFTKSGGGSVDGLALGTSGDTSTNLLFHLQNGMLPDSLNPGVWMILIGTNDMGRTFCSKEATLKGILNVIHYLQQKRPDAKLLVHGLLPRSDDGLQKEMKDENYLVGKYWNEIKWVNNHLEEACDDSTNSIYMEAPDIFLGSPSTVNPETMPDGLHPSAAALKLWGPKIVEQVHKLLQGGGPSL